MAQSDTVIHADAIRIADLFNRGRFSVPWHQRYYDWSTEDVCALLQDIEEAVREGRKCYFLGAIILVEYGDNKWGINDGQQRMITVSLICAYLCCRFADNARGSQREGIALRILFDLSPNKAYSLDKAEDYSPRIVPPQNDLVQYRQVIRGQTIGANSILTVACKEIDKFFSSMSIEHLERYFDFLMGKVEVACLRIPPDVDPNAVYETINSRGKLIDDFDLIRNYFYSHFNITSASEKTRTMHDRLEDIRVLIPSVNKASEYLRCHLQCKFGFLHKARFYRDVRDRVHAKKSKELDADAARIEDYIFSLAMEVSSDKALQLYRTITTTNPDEEFIRRFRIESGTTRSARNLGVFLRELRSYKVAQPLIFATLTRYLSESDGRKRKRLAKIANRNLSRLATFVLRTAFVANKFEPSRFEDGFSNFSATVMSTENIPDADFADFLVTCDQAAYKVLNDSEFRRIIADGVMTGDSKAKQFLLGINADQRTDRQLLNERFCSVEHIFPKSPRHWSGWVEFENEDGDEWVNKIGNLTLLAREDNKPGEKYNSDFAQKLPIYSDSEIALTRKLVKYTDWSPSAIRERQKEMAKRAVNVWKFSTS